jgi:enterochelin esterase-like enzyme
VSAPVLHKHEQFASRILRNRRDIIVYLPPGYDLQPDRRFPALYLQDGQNLFESETAFLRGVYWRVGETADEMILAGKVEPLVIVGIYNAGKSRVREYTPTKSPKRGGGEAKRYGRFLLEELMPFVQSTYRVAESRESVGIGGSSLGALLALYLGLSVPRAFGKIAALSPSIWWNQRVMFRFADKAKTDARPHIWLDIGTQEGPRIVEDVEAFRDLLIKKGWRLDQDLHYEKIEGADHNEAAWARRVGPFLEFLFPAG